MASSLPARWWHSSNNVPDRPNRRMTHCRATLGQCMPRSHKRIHVRRMLKVRAVSGPPRIICAPELHRQRPTGVYARWCLCFIIPLHPRHGQNVAARWSDRRIPRQHHHQKLLHGRGHVRRNHNVRLLDLNKQLCLIRFSPRETPSHHRVQNDTKRPDIGLFPVVFRVVDDLGRRVERTPTRREQQTLWTRCVAESKISELRIHVLIEQNVFRLQIPVRDVPRVDKLQGLAHLLEDAMSLSFIETACLDNALEELAVRAVLHDHVNVLLGENEGFDVHNVWMMERLQNSALLFEPIENLLLHEQGSGNDLASKELAGVGVPAENDHGKTPTSDRFDVFVLSEDLGHPDYVGFVNGDVDRHLETFERGCTQLTCVIENFFGKICSLHSIAS